MVKLNSFEDRLADELQDPEFAAAYLRDAYEESDEEFYHALLDVLKAKRGRITWASKEMDVSRESLYRSLSRKGNPRFALVKRALENSGLRLTIEPMDGPSKGDRSRETEPFGVG